MRRAFFAGLLIAVVGCGGSEFTDTSQGGTSAGGSGGGTGGSPSGGTTSAGGSGGGTGGDPSDSAPPDSGSSDDASGTGGAGGTGGTDGSAGTAGSGGSTVGNSGDCLQSTECPGGRCVELTLGGYRVCTEHVTEATTCAPNTMGGCCTSSDCQGGRRCYSAPLAPSCSGGPVIASQPNVCASDECTGNASCGNAAICVPAGALGRKVAMCMPARCRRDSDCTDAPNGICAPVAGGCCDDVMGLYCVYPNTGCRRNADCMSRSCAIDDAGRSYCDTKPLLCPQ